MLLLESNKQYCAPKCEEVTGYKATTQPKPSDTSTTQKTTR